MSVKVKLFSLVLSFLLFITFSAPVDNIAFSQQTTDTGSILFSDDFSSDQLNSDLWYSQYLTAPAIENGVLSLGSGGTEKKWGAIGTQYKVGEMRLEVDFQSYTPSDTGALSGFLVGLRLEEKSHIFSNTGIWFAMSPNKKLTVRIAKSNNSYTETVSSDFTKMNKVTLVDRGNKIDVYGENLLGVQILMLSVVMDGDSVKVLNSQKTLLKTMQASFLPEGYAKFIGHMAYNKIDSITAYSTERTVFSDEFSNNSLNTDLWFSNMADLMPENGLLPLGSGGVNKSWDAIGTKSMVGKMRYEMDFQTSNPIDAGILSGFLVGLRVQKNSHIYGNSGVWIAMNAAGKLSVYSTSSQKITRQTSVDFKSMNRVIIDDKGEEIFVYSVNASNAKVLLLRIKIGESSLSVYDAFHTELGVISTVLPSKGYIRFMGHMADNLVDKITAYESTEQDPDGTVGKDLYENFDNREYNVNAWVLNGATMGLNENRLILGSNAGWGSFGTSNRYYGVTMEADILFGEAREEPENTELKIGLRCQSPKTLFYSNGIWFGFRNDNILTVQVYDHSVTVHIPDNIDFSQMSRIRIEDEGDQITVSALEDGLPVELVKVTFVPNQQVFEMGKTAVVQTADEYYELDAGMMYQSGNIILFGHFISSYIDNLEITDQSDGTEEPENELEDTLAYSGKGLDITDLEDLVGICYSVWFTQSMHNPPLNITEILSLPESERVWGKAGSWHYWAEPELGYYNSDDPEIIKTHLRQLQQANIDFVIFDCTNYSGGLPYNAAKAIATFFKTAAELRENGEETPYAVFWVNNSTQSNYSGVYDVYNMFFKNHEFDEMLVYWEGEPLLLTVNEPEDFIKDCFTARKMWGLQKSLNEKEWSFLQQYPQNVAMNNGESEELTVSAAHQLSEMTAPNAVTRRGGTTFQQQWSRAFETDPKVVVLTWWNEWTAQLFYYSDGSPRFVDNYTIEASRDIEPMKGGHGDIYYRWMKEYIRAFKAGETMPANLTADMYFLEELLLDIDSQYTKPGESLAASVRAFVNNGEEIDTRYAEVSYTSSNTEVAEISEEGVITAKAEGETDIEATVTYNFVEKKVSKKLIVDGTAPGFQLQAGGIDLPNQIKDSEPLLFTVLPDNLSGTASGTIFIGGEEYPVNIDATTASAISITMEGKLGEHEIRIITSDLAGNELIYTGTLVVVADFDTISDTLQKYYRHEKIEYALMQQLSNNLKQADHTVEKKDYKQAVKHLNDFLKHLDNENKYVDVSVKKILETDVEYLINTYRQML